MKEPFSKYLFFIYSYFFLIFTISAQDSDKFWTKSSYLKNKSSKKVERRTIPNKFEIYELNLDLFKSKLSKSPKRKGKLDTSNTILSFPNEQGKLEAYEIFEVPIMEETLQKKHPNIRSYIGKGIDNPNLIIRFSITSLGLNGMTLNSTEGTLFIDPYTSNKESYIVYSKKNLPSIDPFVCKFNEINSVENTEISNISAKSDNANDGKLRTFRLAVATTGEYSQFHIDNQNLNNATDEEKKAGVLSAIVTTMTRVNGIFERDVALTMKLVDNNEDIIFLDSESDNFTNNDGTVLLEESQTVIDGTIGSGNYDIGHTFSTGGGGLAQLNSPCTSSAKAKGITGSNNPIGDSYAIDYVVHEMGHQFGAHHTFNSEASSCEGNRNDATAVEPGSGSTIMAYAGLCSPFNVESQSDSYFHLVSIREMWANITLGNSTCGEITDTGNNAPTIETLSNYDVPISTPFVLDAIASDIDEDELTYTWEQLDTEIAEHPLVSTATGGPAFRSIAPSSSSKRYFPKLNTVLAGEATDWEVLPTVERTMKFGVTVRDNYTIGGQTASEETTISFDVNSGPFKVTSQAVTETWDAGTAQTITWEIANTNAAPINCSFVNILLSIDGGLTYPITLAASVENNGSHEIVAPNNTTEEGRIKVESAGNIFYALNTTNINIQASEFIMNFDVNNKAVCTPNSETFSFTYNAFLGFNEETTFSATGIPAGASVAFNPIAAISDNTNVVMTISNIENDAVGNYNITVTGTSTSTTKNTVVNLGVYSPFIDSPGLIFPENNAIGVLPPFNLDWSSDVNVQTYTVQISEDAGFGIILEETNVSTNYFFPQQLQFGTTYFWRMKSINECTESSYSNTFSFTTADVICNTNAANDLPLNIPDDTASGVQSLINITENILINDVNATVSITHPWVGDLTLRLISPFGKSIILSSEIGGEGDNYTNTVFDNESNSDISLETAPFTGIFKPFGDLTIFNGEESYGDWALKVVDAGPEDLGKIESWSIEICGVLVMGDDDDKDGVPNSIDLCQNTPLGTSVDEVGCSVFTLPSDNFNIEVISETCPGENNGQLLITATEEHDYFTIINETKYNFTKDLTVGNLTTGTYSICIVVPDEGFEQCFILEVDEVSTVFAKATVEGNKVSIEITQGTAPYHVFIDGIKVLQTDSPFFIIDVNNGDLLEVKTDVLCEGTFSKIIELFEGILAYPNPTNGNFEITLPIALKDVKIEMYSIHSQLISVKTYPVVSGKVQLDLSNYSSGLYIVKIYLEEPISLKIVKQ